MTFARVPRGQLLGAAAALALLLVMAADWWSSERGEEARRIEQTIQPQGAQGGEVGRALREDARVVAEREERTAWQAEALVDRVLLALLLLSVLAPLAAATARAAGRTPRPPWTAATVATGVSVTAALLVAYRIAQEPGIDARTTVKIGPLLALGALAVIAIGSAGAAQREHAGEGPAAPEAADGPDPVPTDPAAAR